MGDAISGEFSTRKDNPFEFKYLKIITNEQDLDKITGPRVILTTSVTLDYGFSNTLLRKYGNLPETLLILTDRSGPSTLTRRLFNEYKLQNTDQIVTLNIKVDFTINEKTPLKDQELQDYLDLHAPIQPEPQDSDSDSEIDVDENIPQLKEDVNMYDVFITPTSKSSSFFKQNKSFKMFPVFERRCRVDEYGEVIDPDVYMTEYTAQDVVPDVLFINLESCCGCY